MIVDSRYSPCLIEAIEMTVLSGHKRDRAVCKMYKTHFQVSGKVPPLRAWDECDFK